MAANFSAWLKIWNGSLINASGACNSDAQPLDIKQNPHKRKTRTIFLSELNGFIHLANGKTYPSIKHFVPKFDIASIGVSHVITERVPQPTLFPIVDSRKKVSCEDV